MSTPTKNLEGRGMKERPINLKSWEVKAILEGRKTVTRPVVKPQPVLTDGSGFAWRGFLYGKGSDYAGTVRNFAGGCCPYGKPGDRLWSRETWAETDRNDGTPVVAYAAGGCIAVGRDGSSGPDVLINNFCWDETPRVDRWRRSIHMPRWASRITLEVTGVRVERLQDISRGDAMAEGCPFPNMANGLDPRHWFADLVEQINGAGSWDANPYVWVIEFKRIEREAMAA